MAVEFELKSKYGIDDLREIIGLLRSENGCPWDREQTHESIRKSLIEETYEVIEAINKKDDGLLTEELGDVLLQVVFHSQIAKEDGRFDFDDVCDGVCKKMIERHPHVFGNVNVGSSAEVLVNWEKIKSDSKNRKTQTDKMLSVPRELPALMRSAKIQEKASKVGFDWDSVEGAFDKLDEEISELKSAFESSDSENILEEMGDLLFSAVNVSRFMKVDPEEALTVSADKFLKRFSVVERLAEEKKIDMKSASLEVLDELWNCAKAETKSK